MSELELQSPGPERGSGGNAWVRLQPSKPISDKWFQRRRVFLLFVALAIALFPVYVASCRPPAPVSGSVSMEQFEAFSRLNDFRGASLIATGELMVKAQGWSEHMADEGRISHSDPSLGVSDGWTVVGENVAYASTIEGAQAALEASPDHRRNMLDRRFQEGGVGVVKRGNTYWITQNFVGR